ncbi:MAG: peptide deformylase [Clostridia bacterium]|jgi:peptide deformylase
MIIIDQSILRRPCEPVLPDEISDLRQKLEEVLNWTEKQGNPGIGLACPQIGISKAMSIIRLNNTKIDLVNPVIVRKYNEFIFEGEGCLSFPGRIERTKRFKEIIVKNDLEPKHFIVTDLLAVVIQHEIDHLNSILLPDVAITE